ncbi:hypothetical protein DYB37_001899 [Aphanomyces astaci]|uniref:Uncharacterized protein n=1 Tax=Aphanomyces astaci TaxID=112090 RepID=A0A418EJL4_APHAT|nr:hypothetical protein DYB35_001038 [Aphanomyces astaci]RHZ14347.1 hypothetical protein DYB37_001899 [Aphanomyces astaci]
MSSPVLTNDDDIPQGIPLALESDVQDKHLYSTRAKDMAVVCDEEEKTNSSAEKLHAARSALMAADIEREAAAREEVLKSEEEAALASFRAALEAKRQRKRDAELVHYEKVVEAVCAASLLEFTERQRIEAQMELDETGRQAAEAAQREDFAASATAARQSKTVAIQSVLDLKSKAHAAKQAARKAIEDYEAKERERQEKLTNLTELEGQRELELQLEAMKQRQEAATARRLESERRAIEAKERAQALRQLALDAAKHMRDTAKVGMAAVLESEDKVREQHYAKELQAVQAVKDEATSRREESERRAAAAAQRATSLREKALQAAKELRSTSKRGMDAVLEKEEVLRGQKFQSQLSAVQAERDEATRRRQECERKASDAAERARVLVKQASLHVPPPPPPCTPAIDTTQQSKLHDRIDFT